jgi:hypothetical protein
VLLAIATSLLALAGNIAASTIAIPTRAKPFVWMVTGALGVVLVIAELRWSSRAAPAALDDVEAAVTFLTRAAHRQWRPVEDPWRVHDPYPIPVGWQLGPIELADHWANICRAPAGAPLERPLLDGRIDDTDPANDIGGVYQRVPSRRLVILGEAGAGKTILTMRLLTQLHAAWASDDGTPDDTARDASGHPRRATPRRAPAIFNLSAWNPTTTTLTDWLASQLVDNHPVLGAPGLSGRCLAVELVAEGRVLPILDGFDEIAPGLRTEAITALNYAAAMPMVLTSRVDEYAAAVRDNDVLTAAAVVTIVALCPEDLTAYLTRATPPTSTSNTRWEPVLEALGRQPVTPQAAAVAQALSTPLMVFLARTVYGTGRDPARLLGMERSEIEDHLLDQFIPTVYSQPRPVHTGARQRRRPWHDPGCARRWHTFLARHLNTRDSHDLGWWQLRDAVPRPIRIFVGGLPSGIGFGVASGIVCGPAIGSGLGFSCWLASGLISGYPARGPHPRKTRIQLRQNVVPIAVCIAVWLVCGIAGGAIFRLIGGRGSGAATGMIAGFGFGLPSALISERVTAVLSRQLFAMPNVTTALGPVSVFRIDRRQAILSSTTFGLLFGMPWVGGFAAAVGHGIGVKAAIGIEMTHLPALTAMAGITFGLAVAFTYTTWGQWLILSSVYLPASRRLPWQIMEFLRDAHERGVLRQAGGYYRYRHARLRDRIAASDGEQRS